MTHTNLIGMFFFRDRGDAYYTGEIISAVRDGYFLIHPDSMHGKGPPRPLELIDLDDMLEMDPHGYPCFQFFRTRPELDVWIEWIDTPSEPRVISIVKTPKPSDMDSLAARMKEAHAELKEAGHVPAIRPVE